MKTCGTCARGFMVEDTGKIACGAAVDDDALLRSSVGNNPCWAWRKYGPFVLLGLPATKNTDCDNMDPNDGEHCAAFLAQQETVPT